MTSLPAEGGLPSASVGISGAWKVARSAARASGRRAPFAEGADGSCTTTGMGARRSSAASASTATAWSARAASPPALCAMAPSAPYPLGSAPSSLECTAEGSPAVSPEEPVDAEGGDGIRSRCPCASLRGSRMPFSRSSASWDTPYLLAIWIAVSLGFTTYTCSAPSAGPPANPIRTSRLRTSISRRVSTARATSLRTAGTNSAGAPLNETIGTSTRGFRCTCRVSAPSSTGKASRTASTLARNRRFRARPGSGVGRKRVIRRVTRWKRSEVRRCNGNERPHARRQSSTRQSFRADARGIQSQNWCGGWRNGGICLRTALHHQT